MTRIGVIGPVQPDYFADNILDCLADVGAVPIALGMPRHEFRDRRLLAAQDFLGRALPDLDSNWQRKVGQRAVEAGCDLVINVWGELMPSAVQVMREAGIPVVLWFPDHLSNLGRLMMFVAPYSRIYFKDALLVERVAAMTGLPVAYLPEACNPHWHRPQVDPGTSNTIVVAGNVYATRARVLERLTDDAVPLEIYGARPSTWYGEPSWASFHAGRSIWRQEKADVFRSAAGVLNNLHPAELTSVNCRLFEAAGSGGAVLCEDRAALHELFHPGEEVLAFSNYDQLRRHASALLEDPSLTQRIGDAAAARALAEHTYPHRLTQILADCL